MAVAALSLYLLPWELIYVWKRRGAFSMEKETWLLQAGAELLLALAFFTKKQAYCEAGTSTPTREFLRGGKEQELGS